MKSICQLFFFMLLSATTFGQTKVDDARLLDYYQTQRFAEASDYLKTVYTEPVTDKKALSQLAYTANMAGKLSEAESYYQRIYEIDSTGTGVLFSLGSINLRRGNNLRAEAFYKMITAKDTTNFLVYSKLAQISQDRGDVPSYVYNLQKANQLNPQEPDVAADLSNMYVILKLTDKAESVLGKAIATDPENIVLLESLMKLTYAQKKWAATVDCCLKLIKSGAVSGQILSKMGVSYYNLKNYSCGAEAFADISSTDQNEFSYYYAAMCFKELKDQKQAIALLESAIKDGISPAIASYYGEIANSNEKLSRFKKATVAYQKGLQFSESPMIYYSLANLYDTNLKDKKNAAKYYKKYLATNPSADKEKNFINYAQSRVLALK